MRTWFKVVAWVVGVVGAILLVLNQFFFEVWRIPVDDPLLAASIEPTLSANDLVVVTRHGSVGRGDLLRCADPGAPGRFVVARALGSSGENVEVVDEVVKLDGKRTPSPRGCVPITLHDPREDVDVVLTCSVEDYGDKSFLALRAQEHPETRTTEKVETGKWYVVSDDRHIHLDSRDFGQVDPRTCQHVVFRLLGAAGFGDTEKRFNIIW
jgi:signal peptidase I